MKNMIVLTGPTAVGKTRLSIFLAKALGGEIVSADSMQVYRHMDIGSAKVTPEEMQGIPHHMIDILDPWEPFNVVVFKEKCEECLPGIYERGHIPIVTGGTGFYIQALLRDIDFICGTPAPEDGEGDRPDVLRPWEEPSSDYRAYLADLAAREGSEQLHGRLKEVDPAAAEAIHPNNTKRVIRALEFYHLTGGRISEHNSRERGKKAAYNACYFVLNDHREKIYAQIDRRVDEMLSRGLVEEVQSLREMGCQRGMVSMQGLGYKEILSYLDGELSLDQAAETIKRDTRHFAKRQLTWFRREPDVIWLNKPAFGYDEDRMLSYMLEMCRQKGIV